MGLLTTDLACVCRFIGNWARGFQFLGINFRKTTLKYTIYIYSRYTCPNVPYTRYTLPYITHTR